MRRWRETAWRFASAVAVSSVVAAGPILINVVRDPYSCATQVCPYNSWWVALTFFGCWC